VSVIVGMMLAVVAVMHLLPLVGVLGRERLFALYGIQIDDPSLEILMRHRAVLFGLLGVFLLYAAFRPSHHGSALIVGLLSVVPFLVLAFQVGGYNQAVRRVVIADYIALACLLIGAFCHWTSEANAASAPEAEPAAAAAVVASDLPFSAAVRTGDTLYLSGQIGVKPGTTELVGGGTAAEARQTLANIDAVLKGHGASRSDVVKCTVMLADIGEWAAFNAIYREFFAKPYPARSAFGTNGLALGARVEVECIAALGARS
jgi:2-iminobutanoate/2-iminopropanoate deaminase